METTVDGKEYYITPQGVMNTDIVEGLYVENNFSSDIVASKMLGIYEKYSKK